MVEWILINSYFVSDLLHYLGDFITDSPPPLSLRTCTPQCAQSLSSAIAVCKNLGLPLHPNKCMPATPQQDLEAISNVAGSLGYGIYFWDLWFYAPHTPT